MAAGDINSVAAGLQILEEGGNAADAAAATILALAVTDYGLFAMGGEVPLIMYDAKKQEVKVLSGVGAAPLDPAAIDWFYEHGIPAKGSMKAAPVPGAVDLCVTALKLYGTMSFEQVVQPTLTLLDAGREPWHGNLAVTMQRLVEREKETRGRREEKLTAVRDRFYRGDIADELETWYIEVGASLRKRDLAAHVTRVEDPVSVELSRLHDLQMWAMDTGSLSVPDPEIARGIRLTRHEAPLAGLHPCRGGVVKTGAGRSRRILR